MALQMSWQQPHQQRRKAPLGLKNLGNSCYLNSVLQCLCYTPPLGQFCLSSQHSSHCKNWAVGGEKECPFCILERQITRCLSFEGAVEAPSKIHKCLTLFADSFRWGRQEDAHEFLRYVIDACHNTCLKLLNKSVTGKENAIPVGSGANTVMKEIFGGALLSQVKCLSCKGESNKNDEMMDISLDLCQSYSLNDALGRFFQSELLDGNNKYSCGNCKKLTVARKQMFILRAPNVLVIQLKRFEAINGGKINRNIDFQEGLVLSRFMSTRSQDPQPEYNLFGSIVHAGCSRESGHYYAYVKDASGRWYCCNDAYVSPSSSQDVLSEKVYILFYIRSNQNQTSGKPTLSSSAGKLPDCNRNDLPPCLKTAVQKPNEISKPDIKQNGGIPVKAVSTFVKTGKQPSTPSTQSKNSSLKNFEIRSVAANGNGNHIHHSGPNGRSNVLEEAHADKKNEVQPVGCGVDESRIVQRTKTLTASNLNGTNGSVSSSVVDHSKQPISSGSNGTLTKDQVKLEEYDTNRTHTMASSRGENESEHASSNMVGTCNAGLKRKSDNEERSDTSLQPGQKSCNLTGKNGQLQSSYPSKHSPEELEKLKEVLAGGVRADLQSCGWVDKVDAFMSARKKLCRSTMGNLCSDTELRERLIKDAKRDFISQIPESLKEHLIGRVTNFFLKGTFLSKDEG